LKKNCGTVHLTDVDGNLLSVLQQLTCLPLDSAVITAVIAQPCDDIDTKACEMFVHSNPRFCQDPSLSQQVCARYCGLCRKEIFFFFYQLNSDINAKRKRVKDVIYVSK